MSIGKYKASSMEKEVSLRDGGAVEGNLRLTGTQTYTKFDLGAQVSTGQQSDGSAFSGTAGETSQWTFRCGNTLSVVPIGTQTLVAPVLNTAGLDISGDQTNNDGWEFRGCSSLALGTLNKDYFTIGTSPAFYAKWKFSIADVSGVDDLRCGFAQQDEAFDATVDDLTDAAWMAVMAGDIKTLTIIANAATVTTDLTSGGGDGAGNWADEGQHTFEIFVSDTGVVTYKIDGATPSGVVAYTFANGLKVTPMWYHINDAHVGGAIVWNEFEFGLQ